VDLSLEFPDDHPQQLNNLETVILLVDGYRMEEDYESARQLLIDIVRRCRAQTGDTRQLEFETLQMAGQLELEMGNGYEASEIFNQLRKRSHRAFGPRHRTTIAAASSLARAKLALGQTDRALALSAAALRDAEDALGADHPDTASVLFVHGRIQAALGQVAASNESLEQALAMRRSHYGMGTPEDLLILGQLVEQYFTLYDYDRAQPLAEEALTLYRSAFRDPQPESIIHLSILTLIHSRRGEFDLALERAKESVETTIAIFGTGTQQVARTQVQLASIELSAGHFEEARAVLGEAIGRDAASLDPYSVKPGALVRLAECEAGLGNFGQADELFSVALVESRRIYGDDNVATAEMMARIARYREQRGQLEEAWGLIEPAVANLLEARRRPDTLLVEALATRARVASAQGQHARASEYFAQAVELAKLVFGPRSTRLTRVLREWDEALARAGPSASTLTLPATPRHGLDSDFRSPPEPFISQEYGIRFELADDSWVRVDSAELDPQDLLVLIRRGPKITFVLRARMLDEGTRQSLGFPAQLTVGIEEVGAYFDASLAAVTDSGEFISREPRTVNGVVGIEYLYLADRAKSSFYHLTWLGVYEGVLYELRTWSNTKRISPERLLRQSRKLQERFSPLQGGAPE
jgi:tetratricopeptide (TPR) repeat protein